MLSHFLFIDPECLSCTVFDIFRSLILFPVLTHLVDSDRNLKGRFLKRNQRYSRVKYNTLTPMKEFSAIVFFVHTVSTADEENYIRLSAAETIIIITAIERYEIVLIASCLCTPRSPSSHRGSADRLIFKLEPVLPLVTRQKAVCLPGCRLCGLDSPNFTTRIRRHVKEIDVLQY